MMIAFALQADLTQGMYMIEDFIIYLPISLLLVRSKASSELKGRSPTSRVFGTVHSLLPSHIFKDGQPWCHSSHSWLFSCCPSLELIGSL